MSDNIQEHRDRTRPEIDIALPAPDIARRTARPTKQGGVTAWWFLLVLLLLPLMFWERYDLAAWVVAAPLVGALGWALLRNGVFTWRRWSCRPLQLYAQGKHAQAEACFQEALARADAKFERDDYRRGFVMTQLADYAAGAADLARAESLYQEALRILCGTIEKRPAEYFLCLNNYAAALVNWKRIAKAAALLELAVGVVEPYRREPTIALAAHAIRFNLIHVLVAEGRLEEAQRLIDEWDSGPGRPAELVAAAEARLACARARYEETLQWCDQAARMPHLARLARCQALAGLQQHDEAAAAAEEAIAGFSALAATHPVLFDYQLILVECSLTRGDLAGATRWRDRARQIAAEQGLLEEPAWIEANERWRGALQRLGAEAAAEWEK